MREKIANTAQKINAYRKFRKIQRKAQKDYGINFREFDVLNELYDNNWVSYVELRKQTGVNNQSYFNTHCIRFLEIKNLIKTRTNDDHTKDAKIKPKGKRLVEKIFE